MGGGNVRIASRLGSIGRAALWLFKLTSQGAKSAQARARNAAKADKGPTSQLKSNAVSSVRWKNADLPGRTVDHVQHLSPDLPGYG